MPVKLYSNRVVFSCRMLSNLLLVVITSVLIVSQAYGDCLGPQMKLLSDDRRRTCTEIFASRERIEYACTSLIKGFPKAMIKYCPVEVCLKNGTWTKPSISCALSECYEEGKSRDYVGHRICTASGRPCRRWDEANSTRFSKSEMFPDYSIQLAENFCRDPMGWKGSPWCFTFDQKKKIELCGIKKCSEIIQMDGSCGPGQQEKDKQKLDDEKTENKNRKKQKAADDDKDSLESCSSEHKLFKMQKDYRIRGKLVQETFKRSTLECATFCSQVTLCRAFTFRPVNGACVLHGGKDYMLIKDKGYKAGVNTCDM